MRVSLIILAAVALVGPTGFVQARELERMPVLASLGPPPPQQQQQQQQQQQSLNQSPTGRLLKRSLCNTFGGCGAKRSIVPLVGSYKIPDEVSEERRYETEDRMIKEILDGIIEHLQRDQNYKQGRYVMYLPKQTRAAASHRQQSNQDLEPDSNNQHSIQANEFEELRIN